MGGGVSKPETKTIEELNAEMFGVFKSLLEPDADLDAGKNQIVTLLKSGANPNAVFTVQGESVTPLICAAALGHVSLIEALCDQGADLEFKNDSDKTVLIFAAMRGKRDAVEMLLTKGAKITAVDDVGATALTWAVAENCYGVVEALLNHEGNSKADIADAQRLLKDHFDEVVNENALKEKNAQSVMNKLENKISEFLAEVTCPISAGLIQKPVKMKTKNGYLSDFIYDEAGAAKWMKENRVEEGSTLVDARDEYFPKSLESLSDTYVEVMDRLMKFGLVYTARRASIEFFKSVEGSFVAIDPERTQAIRDKSDEVEKACRAKFSEGGLPNSTPLHHSSEAVVSSRTHSSNVIPA